MIKMDFFVIFQYVLYFLLLFYTVFWLLVLLEPKKFSKKLKRYPTVTIAIPAWNEKESIEQTMISASKLDYPSDKMKIIAIDDGSSDNTYDLMLKAKEKIKLENPKLDIRCLTQKNGGKHTAMNNALQYVDTEFFATLDADSFPEPDSLKLLLSRFQEDKNIAVASPMIRIYEPNNFLEKLQKMEYAVNHFYKKIVSELNSVHVTPGPLSVYKTKVVKEVNGFREAHKTEDMDMAMRIQRLHYRIVQENSAVVWTKCPYKIKNLYKQRHRWYYGNFKNIIEQRDMLFNKNYGDFGMIQLPMILVSGFLAIIMVLFLVKNFNQIGSDLIRTLAMYDYNIIKAISQTQFNFKLLDLNLFETIMSVTVLGTTGFVLLKSIKLNKEKLNFQNIFYMLAYAVVYPLIIFTIWISVFKDIFFKKKINEWKK